MRKGRPLYSSLSIHTFNGFYSLAIFISLPLTSIKTFRIQTIQGCLYCIGLNSESLYSLWSKEKGSPVLQAQMAV